MQIVKRIFAILRILREHGPTELALVAELASLKSNTAWNILNSLCAEGIVRKAGRGRYALDEGLSHLATACEPLATRLPALAQEVVNPVAEQLRETVIVCVLEHGRLLVVAEAEGDQPVRVSRDIYREGDLTDWATGRVLLAHLSPDRRARLLSKQGLTPPAAEASFAAIRREGSATRLSHRGQVRSFAVPVFGSSGAVVAAMGIVLPAARYQEGATTDVETTLCAAAALLRNRLA